MPTADKATRIAHKVQSVELEMEKLKQALKALNSYMPYREKLISGFGEIRFKLGKQGGMFLMQNFY